MKGVPVKLTSEHELMGAAAGWQRQANAVKKGFPPRHRGGSLWGGHVESACAEIAAGLVMGLPWNGPQVWDTPPDDPPPDLGERTEVRWVAPGGSVLRFDAEKDKDDRYYVLVVGYAPRYEVIGFVLGASCRQERWANVYPERKVYEVPADVLTPVGRRERFDDPISDADRKLIVELIRDFDKPRREKRMPLPLGYELVMYRDQAGEWRWKVVAANSRNVANSGEGYANKSDCEDIAFLLFAVHPREE